MAVLGLRLCARAFSSCGEWGPLFIAVRGPLTVAAPPIAEHRLQTRRLSSCGARAQPLRGMWDPPRPGLEPVSPAPAGGFPTTAPPGKPHSFIFDRITKMVRSGLITHILYLDSSRSQMAIFWRWYEGDFFSEWEDNFKVPFQLFWGSIGKES